MEEKRPLYEVISEALEKKQFKSLCEVLDAENPVDIAEALNDIDDEKQVTLVFRLLKKEAAADAFAYMDPDVQEALIKSLSDTELKAIVEEMEMDDAADLIEEMPANVVARILRNASPQTRKTINELLLYPEDSAGSIMTPEYVSLKKTMTVAEAFDHIRRVGLDKETVYTCYVTENRKLIGVISVKRMLISSSDTKIEDIMHDNFIEVYTTDDKEFVAGQIKKYGYLALPVVDAEQRLVGIVTIDDAMEVIEDEVTEDMEKMAAMSPSEKPYLKTGMIETWKQRIPWLLILMVSATFTGMIISGFENALAACTALTAFIPMLMDTGGNSGAQASVTVIRALALGDVAPRDVWAVIRKELRVAALCAGTLAAANFVKITLVEMLLLKTLPFSAQGFAISGVVCLTLFVTVVFAKLIGCTLPIAAKAIKLDPAVVASPIITTIVDAVSLMVYFLFASKILLA